MPVKAKRLSFICGIHYCVPVAAYPFRKPRHGGVSKRAAYYTEYTWHYSTQGLPALCITAQRRGLLPHIFTFIPMQSGKLFSVALSLVPTNRHSRLFTGGLPYAVQTFLIPIHRDAIARFIATAKLNFITRSCGTN